MTSNRERLMVLNTVRTAPLKCHSFRERSNFPRIWFRDLRFRTRGLEINRLNAHNFVWQGLFFLSLLSRNFNDRLSLNFHRFVILCTCWDTPTVKACLWQLPIVSTAFKILFKQNNTFIHWKSLKSWVNALWSVSECCLRQNH